MKIAKTTLIGLLGLTTASYMWAGDAGEPSLCKQDFLQRHSRISGNGERMLIRWHTSFAGLRTVDQIPLQEMGGRGALSRMDDGRAEIPL